MHSVVSKKHRHIIHKPPAPLFASPFGIYDLVKAQQSEEAGPGLYYGLF